MMNNQDVYIDWSKAPEGTTHAFVYSHLHWCNGTPIDVNLWEKWEGSYVYEWSGRGWNYCDMINKIGHSNRIKKPEEKVMNTNSLEQNIERMEKELAEMKAKLKAGEKWEPKGGDWYVTQCTSYQTKQQGDIASKLMRERNRIIQYVLEHVPDWKFEFYKSGGNYYINFNHGSVEWRYGVAIRDESQDIYMPEWVAEKLADDLNSGRVEL